MKKTLVMFFFMMVLLSATMSFALESEKIELNELESAKLLKKQDVLTIAQYYLDDVYKVSLNKKDKNVSLSKKYIEVFDVEGNIFAYLMPFKDSSNTEIGYLTIGAIEDGYSMYNISENYEKLLVIQQLMKNNSKSTQVKLVLIPPLSYLIEVTENGEKTYYNIEKLLDNSSLESISKAKEKYSVKIKTDSNLKSFYSSLRSSENKKNTINLIEKSVSNTPLKENRSFGYNDTIYLSKWADGSFVPVNNGYYYGGNQHWWPSTYTSNSNGCGPIAAANQTAYLADKNSSKYGALYQSNSLSKTDFMYHMDLVYDTLNPGLIGLLSLSKYDRNVKEFANGRNVQLTSRSKGALTSLDNTITFIREGMQDDSPVAVLNLKKWGYDYGWHWMTITGYRYLSTGEHAVYVSNNAKKEMISLNTLRSAIYWFGGGYIYFE